MSRFVVFLLFFVFSSMSFAANNIYIKAFQAISENRTEDAISIINKIEDKNKIIDKRAGPSLITEAARYDNFKVVKFLIESGVDVDTMNGDAYTALLFSIKNGNSELFDYLFKHGADICSVTKWGETAVDLSDKSKSKMKTKIKNIFFEKKCEEQN